MTEPVPKDAKPPLLTMRGVTKRFGRAQALAGADFTLAEREIHGLLGANGAGKSTLARIIAGHLGFDEGEVTYRNYPIRLRSTRDAIRVGIAIVTQDLSLAPDLTVLENIFLPELGRPGWLDRAALRKRGLELLAGLGQADALPLDAPIRSLSSGQKQIVEIAKALGVRAKLIVFDEPTASLSPTEADRLFDIMARLRLSGRGLVLVSHRFEDMVRIADRVSVMREGRMVVEGQRVIGLDEDHLVRAMLGADLAPVASPPVTVSRKGPPALEVRNLAVAPAVRDVSFSVAAGEILGLGGLVGAGRSEAVEAIFGLRSRQGGAVLVEGRPLKSADTRAAMRAGLGFVAEDRRSQGIVPDFDARENLLLAHLGAHRGIGLGYAARQARITALAAAARPAGGPAARCFAARFFGRHAAEGDARPLAAARPQGAHPRRADQGGRCGHPGGHRGAAARGSGARRGHRRGVVRFRRIAAPRPPRCGAQRRAHGGGCSGRRARSGQADAARCAASRYGPQHRAVARPDGGKRRRGDSGP